MSDTFWKKAEREIGKLLWNHDEPSDLNKPRTGDIKGLGADAESRRWVAEVKATQKESFRVTKGILQKIKERARDKRKLPVLAVKLPYEILFILDKETFTELIETYRDFQNLNFEERLGNRDLIYALKILKESAKKTLKLLERR